MCWTKNGHEELVGIGGWPPISTWINHSSLGSNGLHCIECLWEREKHLLNLHLDELLALLEKLCCLTCWRLSRTCGWKGWKFLTNMVTWDACVQKESLHFPTILSTCFCWINCAWTKAAMVFFYSCFEQTVKKMNFVVWDTTLKHYLGGKIVGITYGIMYIWPHKVTMTLWGRDS